MTIYTNLFTNPQPVGTATGWGSSAGSGGVVTASTLTAAGGPSGGQARRITWTTGSSNAAGGIFAANATVPIAATPGAVYSVGMWVRCSKDQTMLARIAWFDSGYTTSQGTSDGPATFCPANTWTLLKAENQTAPGTAATSRITSLVTTGGSAWAIGDTQDMQAATLLAGSVLPQPFHGSMTSDATHTYAWTGTADASTSTLNLFAPPTGLTATTISSTQIDINYTRSPSATGGEDIRRDGVIVASSYTGPLPYHDTGLTPSTSYSYDARSVA